MTYSKLETLRADNERLKAQLLAATSAAVQDGYRSRLLESMASFAIVGIDLDGRVIEWNSGAEHILGWSAADMLGQPIECIYTPQDQAEGRAELEMQLARMQGVAGDHRWHRRRDGTLFWASGEITPVRGIAGEHCGFLKVLQDRTEVHVATQALSKSQQQYQRLLDSIDEGFCIIELKFDACEAAVDYCFIETNRAFEAHTGLMNVQGRWMRELVPDHDPHWFELYGQVAKTGIPVHFENRAEALGRWFDVRATALDDGGKLVAVLFSDTTAQRDAEQGLRELNASLAQAVTQRTKELMQSEEQLRQSQKMEAVGQLTGGIAHDFNNLLTGISGSLEMMQTRIGQGRFNDLEKYLSAAQGAAQRAAALTHRLLAFSRRQTLDPKPTEINKLIAGMEELIRRTAGPAVVTVMLISRDIWATCVDAHQLENALLNLCINARDAMPDGGTLTIETNNHALDPPAGMAFSLPPGNYVSMSVSDSGVGMSEEVAAKAFEPFFTTKPLGKGTGLGLSMIYGFIRQSGGHAEIYSHVGKGSTITLFLPRYVGSMAAPEPMTVIEMPRAQEGETVLVVDDEPTVRLLATEILEDLGYRAIEASDGASGLQILESNVRIDLLVSDVGLPGNMNGRQMADRARAMRPGLKVLFITGYAEQAVLGEGDLDANMHVMIKPFSVEGLAVRIKSLIGKS